MHAERQTRVQVTRILSGLVRDGVILNFRTDIDEVEGAPDQVQVTVFVRTAVGHNLVHDAVRVALGAFPGHLSESVKAGVRRTDSPARWSGVSTGPRKPGRERRCYTAASSPCSSLS